MFCTMAIPVPCRSDGRAEQSGRQAQRDVHPQAVRQAAVKLDPAVMLLEFGRYAGRTIREVAAVDPDRAGVQISPDGRHVSFVAPRDGALDAPFSFARFPLCTSALPLRPLCSKSAAALHVARTTRCDS